MKAITECFRLIYPALPASYNEVDNGLCNELGTKLFHFILANQQRISAGFLSAEIWQPT